jgi:hypothetical protein
MVLPMTSTFRRSPTQQGPDLVARELLKALSLDTPYEFLTLVNIVQGNLRPKKLSTLYLENIQLRVYEKLQELVGKGLVEKTVTPTGKHYKGLPSLSSPRIEPAITSKR